MTVRGKFRLVELAIPHYNHEVRKYTFQAVCNDGTEENVKFHKYTPNGEIKMAVDNPSANEQFILGEEYYVDFSIVNQADQSQ